MTSGALLVCNCVSSRKRICECLEYSKHYLIKILWRNEQLFSQFCINRLSCLDTSLQYLYRSLSFFELCSNSMASWLILSQFPSLTLWPNRLNYFQVLNKPWVVKTITHMCFWLFVDSADHQEIIRLLFDLLDIPGSWLTLCLVPCVGQCESGCCGLLFAHLTVCPLEVWWHSLSSYVCVPSYIPLTVCGW